MVSLSVRPPGPLHRMVLRTVVTLVGVSIIVFLVLRLLPGNAVTAQMGVSAGLLSHAQLVDLDHYYGVGQPFVEQYTSWLGSLFTGNLGVSLSSRTSVASLIGTALPVTLELAASLALSAPAMRSTTSARVSRLSAWACPVS
jgi:peptide/nickel transport system permease protein